MLEWYCDDLFAGSIPTRMDALTRISSLDAKILLYVGSGVVICACQRHLSCTPQLEIASSWEVMPLELEAWYAREVSAL